MRMASRYTATAGSVKLRLPPRQSRGISQRIRDRERVESIFVTQIIEDGLRTDAAIMGKCDLARSSHRRRSLGLDIVETARSDRILTGELRPSGTRAQMSSGEQLGRLGSMKVHRQVPGIRSSRASTVRPVASSLRVEALHTLLLQTVSSDRSAPARAGSA